MNAEVNRVADMITVALKSGDPIVPRQLARRICDALVSDQLEPGERIAWLVGYASARRLTPTGLDGAIGEANQVADAYAQRFGVGS
jgi:hypothetical protein